MEESIILGKFIKEQREEKGISQAKLAQFLGVQTPLIYKYEKGIIKAIPFEKRMLIASRLGVPKYLLLYKSEKITTIENILESHLQNLSNILFAPKDVSIEQLKKDIHKNLFLSAEQDESAINNILKIRNKIMQETEITEEYKINTIQYFQDQLAAYIFKELTKWTIEQFKHSVFSWPPFNKKFLQSATTETKQDK